MTFKRLNIRGSLLDKNQLVNHIEKTASEHTLKNKSNRNTYPIYNLRDDYKFIVETYNLLTKHLKLGIKIHSAGEWILDNFYIIEETVKLLQKELTLNKYKQLPALVNDNFFGFARIYVLSEEIVAFSNCKIDSELIDIALRGYQKKKMLSMEEIALLGIFLKISLIKHIRDLCERIYFSQIQKYKVESIIERIVEKKDIKNQLFNSKKNIKVSDENLKYPFIEYMSYRLKKYGKIAIKYKEILEKEVQKLGLTVQEVIQKEHFDIANIKITMGNCIVSIKEINRINFIENYSYMNAAEDILRLDPAEVYSKMDEESKAFYRREIEYISKKYKLSERYIAEKLLELSRRPENGKIDDKNKKCHVGYYLLKNDGKNEFFKALEINKKIKFSSKEKSEIYIYFNLINPLFLSYFLFNYLINNNYGSVLSLAAFAIFYLPFSEINIRLINYFLSKLKKPKIIPKIDFKEGILETNKTFIIIPSILKSKEKVEELFRKLEVYYLANKSENLYFALLGDCSEEKSKIKEFDEEVIFSGQEAVRRLNKKYSKDSFGKFHFIYRERTWNDAESAYIGWERKRGYIQKFNEYIKGKINNPFFINTLEKSKEQMPDIKYVITLDSDTNLCLESASKLIGAMEHILNKPEIENQKVVDGYGIMQPRIGMDLILSQKTWFVELYSLKGGIDFYTNAVSDIYQDYFEEGIFTGKGIYNVDVYNEILSGEIPENTVLSHDLLEGNYLRCALLSDVYLLDGYPLKYIPFIMRNHRWTRGDWQIIKWLKSDRLNDISKFKIYDNLRRSLILVFAFLIIVLSSLNIVKNAYTNLIFLEISLLSILIPYILDIVNYIVFKESLISGAEYAHKKFSKELNSLKISFIRMILTIMFIPYEMHMNIDSIFRSIYRMITKTKLLEWVTAEDGEKRLENTLKNHFKIMKANLIFGIIFILFGNFIGKLFGVLFIFGIFIAYFISEENESKKEISEENRRYLENIAKKTWEYFENYIVEENNYLIPDNYQENRINKVVDRTSSTNIGLELLVIISAYDLGIISFKKTMDYLNKILIIVDSLSKWNGHLYNWYDIKNLMPLKPRYISSVDSGNFVGYMYIVKSFLLENKFRGDYEQLIDIVDKLINQADFSKLYSEKNKLLSIGFDLENNKLTDSYYDFLASEARQASLVAIAKKDLEVKHWNTLSRTLTSLNGYKGLISWSGTAFEYLMPNINLNRYKGSLLDESSKFLVMSQIEYGQKLGVPWGISESAFNLKDLYNNYQYKAFGIPWLGLKRGLEDDLVISPYSTFLSLEYELEKGIVNLKRLEKLGMLGKYGFYEALDYTPGRRKSKNKPAVVKTFMAHHQALSFLSLNNLFNDNILKRRFSDNPEIEAVNILLEERMPIQMIITKEKKEKIVKNKAELNDVYIEKTVDISGKELNILSNEKYKIIIDNKGNSISEYEDYMINNYKSTKDIKQRINSYIKNAKTKKIIDIKENAKVVFSPDKTRFIKQENNLKLEEIIALDPNKPVEIRRLEIENLGKQDEVLEIYFDFEPSFSRKMEEYSHPAFNKLFMKITKSGENLIFQKRDRELKEKRYIATSLYTENEQIVDFEYEIDREKYIGRENLDIPQGVKNHGMLSKEIYDLIDPIIAMKRTIRVKPKETVYINFLISVSKDEKVALKNLENIKSEEEIIRTLDICRVRSEEEAKYLQITGDKISIYMDYYKYFLTNIKRKVDKQPIKSNVSNFWKYGISGDNPILLVKIKSIEDVYVIEECLAMYDYYRSKRIYIDFIIINMENDVTDPYLNLSINEVILNKQLEFMKNKNAGIFVINQKNISKEDEALMEFKANVLIDASISNLENNLKEIKEECFSNDIEIKKQLLIKNSEIYPLEKEGLIFDNSYGGFKNNGKEYFIYKNQDNKLPAVWCNILANKLFGCIVTDNLGGYCWSKNSRMNRITAWNNDSVLDIPSELIYIKDEDTKEHWTINSGVNPNKNYYYITHGFGYTKLNNTNNNLSIEYKVCVPTHEELKITKITLKNLSNEERKIKLLFYLKPVLGEDEFFTNGNIYLEKENNFIKINNCFQEQSFSDKEIFIMSNLNINSFTGNKDNFFGEGTIKEPDALYKNLDNISFPGRDSIVALEYMIKLDKQEEKELIILLGVVNEVGKVEQISRCYFEGNGLIESEKEVINYWDDLLGTVKVKTPDEALNILMNGWLVYQTISSRLFAKSGYYQSGGATGFRDQLQDAIGLLLVDSNFLRNQILFAARHQFIEGDVLHWWHSETKKGVRTRFSDDFLWLVYAVIEYLKVTNDDSILYEEVEYLNGEQLNLDEEERYSSFYSGNVKENIFKHCERAINNAIDKGINPFPKIGTGDWNDGFSNIGSKGRGVSVWLGFFLYDILNRFIPICKMLNREDLVKKYSEIKEYMKKNLNTAGWDGRWYKRAITDDGDVIGSISSEECRIDSLAQSWSIISDAADNDKRYIAMSEVENYLIDKENSIIKLFDPPFEKTKINPGYIKAYLPGIRENGGQYTHAACWVMIAFALLGFGDKAYECAKMINPIEHSKTREEAKRFKLEPYVLEADIYTNKDMLGRGGWNWYTGSSSWYYKGVIEFILGLKVENGYLSIKPCIPKEWKEYEIEYKFKSSLYKIKVKNLNFKNFGVEKVILNGQEVVEKLILLEDNCQINNVEIFM